MVRPELNEKTQECIKEAACVTDDMIGEWWEAFCLFDKDGNGEIDKNELGTVLRGLGQNPTNAELEDMIKDADLTGDSLINFNEFIIQMIKKERHTVDPNEELIEAFKVFDKDGNGFITAEELRNVMKNLGEQMSDEDCQEMLDAADIDGDNKISYKEFVEMMNSK